MSFPGIPHYRIITQLSLSISPPAIKEQNVPRYQFNNWVSIFLTEFKSLSYDFYLDCTNIARYVKKCKNATSYIKTRVSILVGGLVPLRGSTSKVEHLAVLDYQSFSSNLNCCLSSLTIK